MAQKINILIVDDNPADIFLIKELLDDSDLLEISFLEADSVSRALDILEESEIDLILLDMFLPDSRGIETFHTVYEKFPEKSIIILSGLSDKQVAFKTVQAGAQDFLLKGEFDERLLEKSIIYSIERKKNMRLLEDSEKKYRALFEVTPLPLLIIEPKDESIAYVNEEAVRVFQFTEDEFRSKRLRDLFCKNHSIIDSFKNGGNTNQQFRTFTKKKDNSEIIVDVILKAIELSEKDYFLVQMEDVTERVTFEKNKLEIINSIQDSERNNFAMELHDGLAQELVLLNIYIDQIGSKAKHITEVSQAKNIVQDALKQTRRLTYNLSPPLLDEGFFKGLGVLFERIDEVNTMGISLEYENCQKESLNRKNLIADDVSYNAFRITQEFLNNSIKHAEATTLDAKVKENTDSFLITISDNGKGFDENTSKSAGMGITNMKQRALLFQLKLEITSEKGKGTSLSLEIPKNTNTELP